MEVVGYAPDEWLIEEAGLGVLLCFNEEFCCEYETRPWEFVLRNFVIPTLVC